MRKLLQPAATSSMLPCARIQQLVFDEAGMPLLEHAPALQASPVDTTLVYGSAGGRGTAMHAEAAAYYDFVRCSRRRCAASIWRVIFVAVSSTSSDLQ